MPAPVVVVHDEVETREAILNTLRAAGFYATAFAVPLDATDAIASDSQAQQVPFGPSRVNGLALNRMRCGSGKRPLVRK